MTQVRTAVFFDLEGPLSKEDYAYSLFSEFVAGGKSLYEFLSRYDDLLTEEHRLNYEPGDTLALILPFLRARGVSVADVARHAATRVSVLDGASETVAQAQSLCECVEIVTTSYSPFALRVAAELGVPAGRVHSTVLSERAWRQIAPRSAFSSILSIEQQLVADLAESVPDRLDALLLHRFDRFFGEELASFGIAHPTTIVHPRGGRRKVQAIEASCRRYRIPVSGAVFIGDSITDAAALRFVDAAGGLAIAFNANTYALAHATMGVASPSLDAVIPILEAWISNGEGAVRELAAARGRADGELSWLTGASETYRDEVASQHLRARKRARGDDTANLG